MANFPVAYEHPRYSDWKNVWSELGQLYEGDGDYLDGSALVAHPRELIWKVDAEGNTDLNAAPTESEKFKRRKAIARYDNIAQAIVDTVITHLHSKDPTRLIDSGESKTKHPLEEFWDDVDGNGTNIKDWVLHHQKLAAVYGHVPTIMGRMGGSESPRNRAEQGRLVLRSYTALDMIDWLAPDGVVSSVKLREVKPRTSLTETTKEEFQYRVVDGESVMVYDKEGGTIETVDHGFGEIPLAMLYHRQRARVPVIGQSMLRDPKVFKDYYNLVSELRELLRSQTFSMLNIQLGEKEAIGDARSLLGDKLSTESFLWTRGPAGFIAPPEGPANVYTAELDRLERRMFRLASVPYDSDSRDAESAESRRLKGLDLNRLLASMGDEAERYERDIARLWFIGTHGREQGLARMEQTPVTVSYPDEYYTQQLQEALEDATMSLGMGLGPTANSLIRKRNVLPFILEDLTSKETADIEKEIDEESAKAEEAKAALRLLGPGGDDDDEDDDDNDADQTDQFDQVSRGE
jgi:hypothetical protein